MNKILNIKEINEHLSALMQHLENTDAKDCEKLAECLVLLGVKFLYGHGMGVCRMSAGTRTNTDTEEEHKASIVLFLGKDRDADNVFQVASRVVDDAVRDAGDIPMVSKTVH